MNNLEEKKNDLAYKWADEFESHFVEGAQVSTSAAAGSAALAFKSGFDAGIQAYKEMLEGEAKETAEIYSFEYIIAQQAYPKAYGRKFVVLEKFSEVLAKLQQQAEKITELESRLKEAESVIQGYASLPDGRYYGDSDMYYDLGASARQYMEKVK
jgi:hypothetical protein